jgi:bifunctional DNA-binding transcriptional regulator/antitoxin component of YhaV-PrlF toxin-antitoxin module
MSVIEKHKILGNTRSDTKEITKIFLSGRLSATLIIPIEMARRHGLEKPSHVIVEERPEGILIKKLEL